MQINKNLYPLVIALAIGILAAAYYVWSGRSSYDQKVRELVGVNGGKIEKVDATDSKKIQIKCKNGESYEISFSDDQSNYEDLIFNACGPEGSL